MRRQFARRLAAVLRGKDETHRLRPSDLARACRLSKSTINSYLAGRALPTGENLIQISKHLRVSVSFLLPSSMTTRDSIEKKGEELGVRIGPRLLDRLLDLQSQRLRRELHGMLGMIEEDGDRIAR